MLTKNQNQSPIYFDAEIVDERTQHIQGEQYDSELVQEQIAQTDGGVTVIRGIAQGAVLAGFQVASTQSLYLAGCVGLFPAVVAGLPVGLSVAGSLCYLRFENSFIPTISDRALFGLGVTRTLMLAASSWKLTSDAQQMNSIARNSFSGVTQQVKQYEGIQKPQQDHFPLILGFTAVVAVIVTFCCRKK
ncbi:MULTISPECIES: hypothetical protein [Nostoc]|uniref:Uncharacterized protein n=1 Tax=Nostoc paludosum FACHB-159 TaxID=2692908 RepID=A0ABR8KNP5_9NOSO|nr:MULTISPECIES: hypothetical protein [Nostoc]MBD2683148.1 hypothetical protein [Nostoc sp. FACHB-857]MBD2739493.1 hypothetical protein [Nostoc paludosum FACHB-159]